MQPRIPRLLSGGIITNYFCTSSCRHCAYFSSPHWNKDYMSVETAAFNLAVIKKMGCRSVHIGGGEPLLRPDKLIPVLKQCMEAEVSVEYIETNCSWYREEKSAKELLTELMRGGVSTLLISISPFHNEYIPFSKTESVLRTCRETGMGIFPWVERFIPELQRFDADTTHSLREYEDKFGEGYIESIPEHYWVSLRGRALATYKNYMPENPVETILKRNRGPCRELFEVSHFHVDLFGNYIPGLCTGLSIAAEDLCEPISSDVYPYLTALMTGGIAELIDRAADRHGFVPKSCYVSKCDLCYEIRKFLVIEKGIHSKDLKPAAYYRND